MADQKSESDQLQMMKEANRHLNDELVRLSDDVQNLLSATRIPTLFLDEELRVVRFTASAAELFAIRETDHGRPLADVAHQLVDDDLVAGVHEVLEDPAPIEREVRDEAGRSYLVRIVPYHSSDERMRGVVLTFVDITPRKEAEGALTQAHAHIHEILESVGDAFYVLDHEWRLTFVNRKAEEYLQRPRAELLGSLLWEMFPEAKGSLGHRMHLLAARERRPVSFEMWFDRLQIWAEVRIFPSASGLSVYFRDISERKESENALRESEERYRLLVENAREYAIIMLDREGRIALWSAGARRIFGYSEEEALGADAAFLFTGEDREAGVPAAEMLTAARMGRVTDERWQTRRDGTLFWASGAMEPLRAPDGEIRGFTKVLRDNTRQKQAEQELRRLNQTLEERVEARTHQVREQEQRFRRLVESAAAVIWNADADGRVEEDSPTWRAFTGQTPRQGRGLGWLNAIHAHDRGRAVEEWRHAVDTRTPLDSELRVYHAPSGTYRWCAVRAVPLPAASGDVRGWFGMNLDIDELKRAEERIRDMASRLTMSEQEERGRIATLLHDDLQQLMYAIQMKLALAHQRALKGDIEALMDQTERSLDLLHDAIAKTRQLTVDLNPPVLKEEGLVEAVQWIQTQMREMHRLDVRIEGDAKVQVEPRETRILLFQAIRELLFNVAKHAETDHASVEIVAVDDHVRVTVSDEGCGFDPDQLDVSADLDGGFGLFSVRERIGLQGGSTLIHSRPGEGTRVVVRAPMSPAARAAP